MLLDGVEISLLNDEEGDRIEQKDIENIKLINDNVKLLYGSNMELLEEVHSVTSHENEEVKHSQI